MALMCQTTTEDGRISGGLSSEFNGELLGNYYGFNPQLVQQFHHSRYMARCVPLYTSLSQRISRNTT